MRKIILLIAILLLELTQPLAAQQPTYDFMHTADDGQVLFFKITDENASQVTVVPQYSRTPRYEQMPKDMVTIPSTVDFNGHRYVVTAIADRTFMGCKEITAVRMPNTLRVIGAYAFSGCQNLVTAEIPQSVTKIGSSAFSNCQELAGPLVLPAKLSQIGSFAFSGCQTLSSLQLPEMLASIGSSAFKDCNGLRGSVTITPSVTSIGNNAFSGCTRLSSVNYYGGDQLVMGSASAPVFAGCVGITSVNIGDNVHVIPDNAFKGCISLREMSLPQNLTAIGHSAFYQCGNLEGDLVIPNSVTSIGGSAFYGCSSLSSLRLSENLKEIANFAFYQCSGLEGKLVLPEGVTSVGNAAFKGCSSLTGSLDLPAGIASVGDEAFMGCERLSGTLTIPIGLNNIGNSAFADCRRITTIEYGAEDCKSMGVVGHAAFHGCTSIRTVTIFSGVKQIPSCAFSNCSNLAGTLKIPAGCTVIGANAFSGCTQITAVEFPDDLTEIKSGAFRGCTRLDGELTIPKSVHSIGNNAFENCISIASILLSGYPPQVGSNTFQGVSSIIPVRVPCKSLIAYQNNENWRYFSRIEGNGSENTLRVSSANDSMGLVRIIQRNSCSYAQAIVQAVPVQGFMFTQWADGNTDNPRTLVVNSDTLLEAQFDSSYLVQISASGNDGALGSAMGSGEYEPGEEATLIAVPRVGSTFLGWSDGCKDNPRKVVARGAIRYVALFENADMTAARAAEASVPTLDDLFPITVKGHSITITGTKGHAVRIYDDYGRSVTYEEEAGAAFQFKVKESGNYLVRIDDGETRRVVIAD